MEGDVFVEICIMLILLLIVRLMYVMHKITTGHSKKSLSKRLAPCKTIICIGSGGHTTEMLNLIKHLNFENYSPRIYVIANTDKTSHKKVKDFEESKYDTKANYSIYLIPRSREVHQSFITSFFMTIYSALYCIPLFIKTKPDLILCNGPGTCIPLCIVSFLMKCCCVSDTRIVFIESFCRVKTLSLTGKLLLYIADNFLVQWPELKQQFKRTEYIGQLL